MIEFSAAALRNWNDGMVGLPSIFILLRNITMHEISQIMDRKNVKRGFKQLRVWQDAVSLYILACKTSASFPFGLKKAACNCNAKIAGTGRTGAWA